MDRLLVLVLWQRCDVSNNMNDKINIFNSNILFLSELAPFIENKTVGNI